MNGDAVPDVAAPTRESVLAKLAEIDDPCSVAANRTMDIVNMGLVGALDIDGPRIGVALVLTEPACWYASDLMRFVEDKLRTLPGVQEVEVRLDHETIWTPDRVQRMPPYLGRIPVRTVPATR